MAITRFYTATSIDGFLADEHNSLDWLFQVSGEPEGFAEFFAGVGAFAMGSTTYEWVLENEHVRETPQKWRDWYGSVPAWVFSSRTLEPVPGADIRFVRGDVRPVHAAMVETAAEKDLWIVGGGDLAGQFADAGLLDEVIVSIAPVTLGAGAPLLPRRLELRLDEAAQNGDLVCARYCVVRAPG